MWKLMPKNLKHEVVRHVVDEMSHFPSLQSASVKNWFESAKLLMSTSVKKSDLCPPSTRECPLHSFQFPEEREEQAILLQRFNVKL